MQTLYKTLLASSLILLATTNSLAEQPMVGPQGPVWGGGSGPTPITWGDCIPVPIASMPMPMQGMPLVGGYGNTQHETMPPPSPFFGNMPSPMIPMPAPMAPPPMFGNNPAPLAPALNMTCDDGSQEQLHMLQGRYNQAAAASKAKIEEITLAMQDAQNQMADARVIIEELSKQQVSDQSKITGLEKISSQAAINKGKSDDNLSKVLAYADEVAQLKQKNQAMLNENEGLKNTFSKMDNAYKFMESKLEKLTSQQTMNAVTNINNDQSKNIIEALKTKIENLGNTNKTHQSQLALAQKEAGAQARKLTALGQSATELTALRSAYKSRNDENDVLKTELAKIKSNYSATTINSAQSKNIIEALKAKVASLGDSNKTLQSKLGTFEMQAGSQARKITVLGQSAAELTALRSAYKSKSADNEALMAKLIEFNNKNKTLQSQLVSSQS